MRVAIVGSGPAGASAGYHLAAAGHEVTLFDRAQFPRDKTCGDWITPGAVTALGSMGVPPSHLRMLASEWAPVEASLLAAPNAAQSRVASAIESYCIPRMIFDEVVWRQALAAGCRFERRNIRDREMAGLRDDFERIVDARGAIAGRTNSAGLRAYWTVRAEDCELPTTVQMFADPVYRLGYGWVFPVGHAGGTVRVNVGVGAAKAECAEAGKSLPAFFDRFIEHNPAVRRMSERALDKSRPAGYPVALAESAARITSGGILRIGDAANLTDPLTGEGIASALLSGELVARAIHGSRDVADAAARWQRAYDETFAPDFSVALRLQRLLASTRAKNTAMWVFGHTPWLARRFHHALSGTLRYRDLFPLGV